MIGAYYYCTIVILCKAMFAQYSVLGRKYNQWWPPVRVHYSYLCLLFQRNRTQHARFSWPFGHWTGVALTWFNQWGANLRLVGQLWTFKPLLRYGWNTGLYCTVVIPVSLSTALGAHHFTFSPGSSMLISLTYDHSFSS